MARRLVEEDRAVAEKFAAFSMKESTTKNEESSTKKGETITKNEHESSTMAPPMFKFNVWKKMNLKNEMNWNEINEIQWNERRRNAVKTKLLRATNYQKFDEKNEKIHYKTLPHLKEKFKEKLQTTTRIMIYFSERYPGWIIKKKTSQ